MAELRARLEEALQGSFTVERELGQGGMAKVFLARDVRHGRLVALKVFLPEVAAAFGHGRFLREIKTAANLSHPSILSLYDSGEAAGLLYYVMPYVEGESLAQRLAREGPLPVAPALGIARQVAAALQHAHARGIVHRDIKPGNILLSGDTAFVADFGIAHALEEGGEKLTSTGLAIGTPAYMSPEQISGSDRLDGRADIYSLGCVLYEMLAGEPPFTGRSAQVILARHSVERVPSLRAVRDTIPLAVEHVIHRALAKTPADRFASAEEFAAALAPERLSQALPLELPTRPRPLPHRWVFALGSFAGLGLVVLVALAPWSHSVGKRVAPDPDAVAVLPFRALGAPDSGVSRLAASLAGLFAEHLPGDGGPRAVADSSRAGLRLEGELAPLDDRLVLGARLVRASSGEVLARVEKLTAARDMVVPLVDRALTRLLAATAGETPENTDSLAALPLPAVRAYLAARRAFFQGDFDGAAARYTEVLRTDSAFAPAALGLASAGRFLSDSIRRHGVALAMAMRPRLSLADRNYLLALAGPAWPRESGRIELIMATDSAAREAPDRPERLYLQGEILFHEGPWTGAPGVLHRAEAAFRQAVALEPRFVPALGHLLDLAASAGDTAAVRALGGRYLALDSIGNLADYYRWRVALALHDERALKAVRRGLDSLSEATLERIVNVTQLDGLALQDGLDAAKALWSRGGIMAKARWGYTKRREIALNLGRPNEALAILRARMADAPLRPLDRLSTVVDALYWDADTSLAASLVGQYAAAADAHTRSHFDPADRGYYDVCAVGLWRMAHGDSNGVPAAIADLRRVPERLERDPQSGYLRVCVEILSAQFAAATRDPGIRERIAGLDSLARNTTATTWLLAAANLTAAHLWEQQGEPERALAATRRRAYITDLREPRVLVALTTFLREEGRLAAKTGDREGAIRAYRRYLALRANPEPALVPQRTQVKAELAALERTGRN